MPDLDNTDLDPIDAERLELLDRMKARLPDIDLDQHSIDWMEMPDDGSQGLLIDGGGIDGGNGYTIASRGEDLHAVGTLAPMFSGTVGCVVIAPDGTRRLAGVVADPLAE